MESTLIGQHTSREAPWAGSTLGGKHPGQKAHWAESTLGGNYIGENHSPIFSNPDIAFTSEHAGAAAPPPIF